MFDDKRFFCDAYSRDEEGGTTFVYRTGMFSFVEALRGGSMYAIDYNGAGYSPHCTTIPEIPQMKMNNFIDNAFAFELNVDGQRLHSHWTLLGYSKTDCNKGNGIRVTVSLRHTVRKIDLDINTFLDGTGILCRWLEIKNTGVLPAAICNISIMSGALNTTLRYKDHLRNGSSLYRLGYMEDFRWGCEGDFRWHDVIEGGQYFTSRYGRERYRHPMFLLENRATGGMFIGQLAYSGGYRFDFDFNGVGNDAHLSYKASIDGYSPIRVLDPGETTKTPEMHLGFMFGGMDACINEMNRHIRRSVIKFPRGDVRIAPQETGIGPEMDMSSDAILASIDAAAARGSDIFFIDASWYCPKHEGEDTWLNFVGDWFPDELRYDIDHFREYAHKKGVKFGLWMEPERMGPLSRIFKEHPEYCTVGYDGKVMGAVNGGGGMIDLSKDEAAKWVEEQIVKLIETYKIDLFRLDYNVGQKCSRSFVQRGDYLENSEYRYYENYYGIFDRVRARFPKVVFEGCASGGGRTDLGMVSRLSHTWVTDWQFAPRSFMIINGLSMCLPPEMIDRLCGGQNNHTLAEVDFQMRLLLFGRPSVGMINPDSYCKQNPIHMDRVNHFVKIYNEVVRPMHETGSKIYHHTPDLGGLDPHGNGILELTNADGTEGIMGIFSLSDPESETVTVRFKGLDISRKYKLTMDNHGGSAVVSGYKLMNSGVTVNLPCAFVSELLIVKAVD